MFQSENVPPLPTPNEYAAAAHRVEILLAGDEKALGRVLMSVVAKDTAYKHFIEEATVLAGYVEPIDRSTGDFVDPENGAAKAFHRGATAGLLVDRQVHGTLLMPRRLFSELTLGGIEMDPDDMPQTRHLIAEAISEMGFRGLQVLGDETAEQVSAWSERFVLDVTKQRMFTIGAGVLVLLGRQQHEAALNRFHREAMETLVASVHDVDWDYQLAELTKPRINPDQH
ncbi:MAG TPA: hypothetical protein VN081_01550 [Dongiaceae bacterium]|nr:hypothetical protein [Dongiaceae bacterium]